MATVTGFTAARMLQIENASVVDGDVVGDNLVLTKHDGTTVNAGNVRGRAGLTHKGPWLTNDTYVPDDAVTYSGSTYRVKIPTQPAPAQVVDYAAGPAVMTPKTPVGALIKGASYSGSVAEADGDRPFGAAYRSDVFQIDVSGAGTLILQQTQASVDGGAGERFIHLRKENSDYVQSGAYTVTTPVTFTFPAAGRYYLFVGRSGIVWNYAFTILNSSTATFTTPSARQPPSLDTVGFEVLAAKGAGLKPKGAWDGNLAYDQFDVVGHLGSSYSAKAAVPPPAYAPLELPEVLGYNWSFPADRVLPGITYNMLVGGTSRWDSADYKVYQLDVVVAGTISPVVTGTLGEWYISRRVGGIIMPGATMTLPVGKYWFVFGNNSAVANPVTLTVTPGTAVFGSAALNVQPTSAPTLWDLLAAKGGASLGSTLAINDLFTTDLLSAFETSQGTSMTGLSVVGGFLQSSDTNDHWIKTAVATMVDGKSILCFERQAVSAGLRVALAAKFIDENNFVFLQFDSLSGDVIAQVRESGAFTTLGSLGALAADVEAGEKFWLVIRSTENHFRFEAWSRDPRNGGQPTAFLNYKMPIGTFRTRFGKDVTGKGAIRLYNSAVNMGRIDEFTMVTPNTTPEVF